MHVCQSDAVRSLVLDGTRRVRVEERPEPRPEATQVVVRPLACGLCGTDRHIYEGEYPSTYPVVLGHEFGGVVSQASEDSAWQVGDVVSVDPNISCGACPDCALGRPALCPTRIALGVDIDGGFSEAVVVPETQLHRVRGDIDPLHLAFVEPLACCLRGIDLAHLTGGESVAVVGGGVIGQLIAQVARMRGASRVTMITRQQRRRELAEQLGATDSWDSGRGWDGLGRPYDVVFECAGVLDTFSAAQGIARRGGSVILLGIPPEEAIVAVSPFALVRDELRIQGSFLNPLTQGRAADLVASGDLELDPLISRVIGLDDVGAVLAAPPGEGDIKYVVQP